MKMDPVIFREYDIRGVYNQQFDCQFAVELGKAVATFAAKKSAQASPTISIGFDARHSSPDLARSLAEGVLSCGANVITLGLITTPMSYYSTFTVENLDGAIMVTGSHNPPDYNGFKISIGKTTIHGEDIKTLEKIISTQDYLASKTSGQSQSLNILPSYVERYKREFGTLENIPFVVDCGNGAAGSCLRSLYEALGLEPTYLFEKPDGNFPNHHPDPTVEENLKSLAQTVKEKKAVIGIGFDGDADRIGLVDHEGKMIYGDELLAFYARSILQTTPGGTIIADVKCSDKIFDDITAHSGRAIMWKSGHSLVKDKVKQEKALLGGEMSGHVFFADRNYGYDDAPYAGLRVIEILAKTGKNFRELLDLPKTFSTPEIRIETTEEKKHLIVEKIKKYFAENHSNEYSINEIDGIRISFSHGWALVRSSNTQPVVVFRFESTTEDGLQSISNQIKTIVKDLIEF